MRDSERDGGKPTAAQAGLSTVKKDFSEDALIEQPAIELFGELGWETANCFHEFEQAGGSPLGRETASEVVLVRRLRTALEKLNPTLPAEAITQAIEEITRDRSRMSLAAADQLWANSNLKPSEFSTPVLGLIFLRYADHRFTQAQAALAREGQGAQGRRRISEIDYQAEGVLYLPDNARFSNLRSCPEDET